MPAKIMVVDDLDLLLDFTCHVLKEAGYEVFCTSDIPKAISTFGDFAPDCCVLDYHMPQMLGSELARRLHELDRSVEIIFLTAEDEASLAVELMKSGAVDYLIKPVDSHRLLASISRALEHRRLVKENLDYRLHLEAMVAQQTAALNASLRQQERLSAATLKTLGLALDFRDQSTSGHSQRVASNTTSIAREIGISGDRLLAIEHGAFLHDIGKLKIPDGILLKPGKLTSDEWVAMRLHPHHGREFLSQIDFLSDAAQLVFTHHEKFDGSGYPQGLKGESIPIGARIFCIVDAIDAMTYPRPYNRPISTEKALEEVQRCAGAHFDPEIARVVIDSARRGALASA
jgi:response regulator RpfG family c-di-GMP phosphodiesterase